MSGSQVTIRDRVVEFRRVPAGELLAHPQNWRTHPDGQRKAFAGVLEEVGFAGAVLARETPDGLQIIDGHLRQEELAAADPAFPVPVIVLDVDDAEAAKLLATFDPLGGLAGTDAEALKALLLEIETDSDELQALLDQLAEDNEINLDETAAELEDDEQGIDTTPDSFEVIVRCKNEEQQKTVYDSMVSRGYDCKLVTV